MDKEIGSKNALILYNICRPTMNILTRVKRVKLATEMVKSGKHVAVTIILLIIILSTALTINTHAENSVTTTYPEVTYTVSETTTYTSSNTPKITVLMYSDGSIKVKIHVNWSNPLPQGFHSQKEIEFYDDHVIYNYEFESPNWEVGNNDKFSYIASGKSVNDAFHGNMIITYINATSKSQVNVDYIVRALNDSAMISNVNITIDGSQKMIDEILNTIRDINKTSNGITIKNIDINKLGGKLQLKMQVIISVADAITIYNSESFILPPILGEAIPTSPDLLDKVVSVHVEANITNLTFTMKQSGEYKVGYKEFLNSIVDTLNKSQDESASGSGDMAKLLSSLIDNFETFNGEKFIYTMNSTGQEIILPKIRKTDSKDPLETLTALRDVVLEVIPEDEKQEFLNTTIQLEPGESNIKSIMPDVVKLSDLDKVEVEIASSNKYLGVASATAIFAIIIIAVIIMKRSV